MLRYALHDVLWVFESRPKTKKATLKQDGFSHLFSAKKYLETR